MVESIMDFYRYFSELTADRRAQPDRRPGDADRQRQDRRRRRARHGEDRLLRDHRHRRPRHHATRWPAGLRRADRAPGQLPLLQTDPTLMPNAVDEMIRWAAPVRHFMRTAQADTEIGGVPIEAGDWVYLSYLAATGTRGVRRSAPLRRHP